jgi:hypothetical protein
VSGEEFAVFQSDADFYEKISPVFNGKKYLIPFPTLCPDERQRRRMMFRNQTTLYKRICDISGKSVVSVYAPNNKHIIYEQSIRWSDAFDGISF